MNKLISSTTAHSVAASKVSPAKVSHATTSFDNVLKGYVTDTTANSSQQSSSGQMLVGVISSKTQTVSELLMQHKELSGSTWDILGSEQNKNKEYTRLQPGTRIYYDTNEGCLSWSKKISDAPPSSGDKRITHSSPLQLNATQHKREQGGSERDVMQLGILSDKTPTVSHLLKSNPALQSETWEILSNNINRDKPFHKIADGTEIFFNPSTKEVSWRDAERVSPAVANIASVKSEPLKDNTSKINIIGQPANDLSEAVRPYLGISYKEINCYELLVKGLRQMDIPYEGKNGLSTRLTRMALDRGMAANAYLNGEGIVKAAGSLVLSKKYPGITNWKDEAASLMQEIEPLLDNGQILSFSTEKRGHTGIVSQQKSQWTFINSGRLDNSVGANSLRRGVGEEILHKEIRNWFKLAQSKGESLSVTLGRLNQPEIQTAYNMSDSLANRI